MIVFTGREDVFTIPPSSYGHHGDPGGDWDIMSGVTRAVEAICTIEKPVIAKVNGHAVGFGANLVLGCDFIVAREDAIIADHHMSAGDLVIDGERKAPPIIAWRPAMAASSSRRSKCRSRSPRNI